MPPTDQYHNIEINDPLPEVDEIRCMLAQIALRTGNLELAQMHYHKIGAAGTHTLNYDRRRMIRVTDWPQPKQNLAWIDRNSDDIGTGMKPLPPGRNGFNDVR